MKNNNKMSNSNSGSEDIIDFKRYSREWKTFLKISNTNFPNYGHYINYFKTLMEKK